MIDRLASDSLSVALRHAQAGEQFAVEAERKTKPRRQPAAAAAAVPPPPAFSLARPQWTPIPGTRVSLRQFLDEYKKLARGQKAKWTGPGGWQKDQHHYIWDAPKLDATRPLYVGEVLARPDKPTAERLLPQRIRDHLRPKTTKKKGAAPTDSEQLNQLLQIAQAAGGGSVSVGGKTAMLTPDDIFITPIGINKDPTDPVNYDTDPNARHAIEQQLKAQLNPLIGHDLTKYPVLGFEDDEEETDAW
ncbi:MAG: hypothetical protein MUE49_04330 [Rhodospirillales bacterium]|nr:hypothetical protein [Rhodospirillales bacterium]